MTTRRALMGLGSLGLVNGLLGCGGPDNPLSKSEASSNPWSVPSSSQKPKIGWRMPDESDPHNAIWMAFAANKDIWGDLSKTVQENLTTIAKAISQFEPVKMLVSKADFKVAQELLGATPNVKLFVHEIDDLWMRDTGCVFVRNELGQLAGVSFNFNGWGNKPPPFAQPFACDATVAEFVATKAGTQAGTAFPLMRSTLTLEGGGIEVDGAGTAIITESCVLNKNRNPGDGPYGAISKDKAQAELKRLLGLEKIIWLDGLRNQDITDGHTDFYARFLEPGVLVVARDDNEDSPDYTVTRRHLAQLAEMENKTDAQCNPLKIIELVAPKPGNIFPEKRRLDFAEKYKKTFAGGYVNFLITETAVFMPQFGDAAADKAARDVLADALPGHNIIQLNIDAIAAGGGGIHCTTQQEPKPRPRKDPEPINRCPPSSS